MKKIISGILATLFILTAVAVPVMASAINLTSLTRSTVHGTYPGVAGNYTGYKCVASLPGVTVKVTAYGGRSYTDADYRAVSVQNTRPSGNTLRSTILFDVTDSGGNAVPGLSLSRAQNGWTVGRHGTSPTAHKLQTLGTVYVDGVTYTGRPNVTGF